MLSAENQRLSENQNKYSENSLNYESSIMREKTKKSKIPEFDNKKENFLNVKISNSQLIDIDERKNSIKFPSHFYNIGEKNVENSKIDYSHNSYASNKIDFFMKNSKNFDSPNQFQKNYNFNIHHNKKIDFENKNFNNDNNNHFTPSFEKNNNDYYKNDFHTSEINNFNSKNKY